MIKAIIILCPNEIRRIFCQKFFELFEDPNQEHKIPFVRSIVETTEENIKGLVIGQNYVLISRELFNFKKKSKNYYIATEKIGVNGHTSYQGFSIEAFNEAKRPEKIVIYDTSSPLLVKQIKDHYAKCSSSFNVHTCEILETGFIKELGYTNSEITYGPEVPKLVFDHIFKLISESVSI